ncbi:MAG: glycosyltransferase [Hydrogenothermaceae bacterium]|nr:glycosyltransferase [Hydrogenothermaceae bacterium]
MMNSKVSILIATYNQEDYIKEAVNSALNQTYDNLEVIVSDDCSTDNTFKILSEINDKRLKIYRNHKNIGRIANHRKLLYEYATGEFVAFLDGDDFYIYDDFVKDAVDIFLNYNDVISVLGGYEDLFYTGERKQFISVNNLKIVDGVDILFRKCKVRYAHGSWIFRRDLINKFEFFSGKVPIGDDLEGWFKSLFFGKVALLPKAVFTHRIHFDNGVVKVDVEKLLKDLYLYDIIKDFGISIGYDKNLMSKWRDYYILKQAESFVSWAYSLYKRKIYTKEHLEKLLYEFTKSLKALKNV